MLVVVLALVLGACGSGSDGGSGGASDGLTIVASTDVYADIAAQVAGDHATVTAIIDAPNLDPHGYEASTRDILAVSRADIVIENGGGYDAFMQTLWDAADNADAVLVNVVDLSGHDGEEAAAGEDADHGTDDANEADDSHGAEHAHDHEGAAPDAHGHDHDALNEHVWYDLPTVAALAEALRDALVDLDPANAPDYRANATRLLGELDGLTTAVDEVRARHEGVAVAVTEPVPLFLLEAAGLVNRTPAAFSRAVEHGEDAPPAVLASTLALFADGEVELLVQNAQTAGVQTDKVVAAAHEHDVEVVAVTETLPAETTFVDWMRANIDALAAALDGTGPGSAP